MEVKTGIRKVLQGASPGEATRCAKMDGKRDPPVGHVEKGNERESTSAGAKDGKQTRQRETTSTGCPSSMEASRERKGRGRKVLDGETESKRGGGVYGFRTEGGPWLGGPSGVRSGRRQSPGNLERGGVASGEEKTKEGGGQGRREGNLVGHAKTNERASRKNEANLEMEKGQGEGGRGAHPRTQRGKGEEEAGAESKEGRHGRGGGKTREERSGEDPRKSASGYVDGSKRSGA